MKKRLIKKLRMKTRIIKWLIQWVWVHHEKIFKIALMEFDHHTSKNPGRRKEDGAIGNASTA